MQLTIFTNLDFNPMSILNLKLKNKLLVTLIFCSSLAFCQEKVPDTLVVNSKAGKIILISDSIAKFKTANVQTIINKAIDQIRDSLVVMDSLFKKKTRLPKDSIYSKVLKTRQVFAFQLKAGGAFAAGRFAPELGYGIDFAPQRQDFYFKDSPQPNYTFINLSLSSLWFFEKPNNEVPEIYRNIFLEASFGNRINNSKATGVRLIDEFSFGAGYLVQQKGNYFEQNTLKLFLTFVPKNSFIGFKPEMYFFDNYKLSYLGMSIRFISPLPGLSKRGLFKP